MRQVHRAGEKAFVDYSGKKPHIVDRETGEVIEVELFVMVLGASNYTYAEVTRTQRLADFVASNVRAFDYYGCVPEVLVPDQLRSAVSGTHRYDPDINPTYLEMAQHYGIAIIPARPKKPKDKAKVEVGVQVAQRWKLLDHQDGRDGRRAARADEQTARPQALLRGAARSAHRARVDGPAEQGAGTTPQAGQARAERLP
jgi:transposase